MPLTLVDTASESPSPLSTSALEALTSLAPAPKYLKIRSRTAQGIDVDGEFIINSNGVPVLLPNDDVGSASLVPSGHFRYPFIRIFIVLSENNTIVTSGIHWEISSGTESTIYNLNKNLCL